MTDTKKKRNLLRLKSLRFVSLVDVPANEHSTLIAKSDDVTATARIVKVDESLNVLIGFANVSTVGGEDYTDLQDDITSEDELLKVCLEYAEAGAAIDEMHSEREVDGVRTVFLFPLTGELSKSLGIGDVQKTGILIGVKVPPEVTARAKNGEINGFSIGALGTREPLEKSAEDLDRARLEKQAAKVAEAIAKDRKIADDNIEWCLGLVEKMGVDGARQVAKLNLNSVCNWAETVLERLGPEEQTIEKAAPDADPTPEQIIKSHVQTAQTAQKKYDAIIAKRMNAQKVDRASATVALMNERDPDFAKAYAELDRVSRLNRSGPVLVCKALDNEAATLDEQMAKAEEAFGLAHNLTTGDAKHRLPAVSNTYKSQRERRYAIDHERRQKQTELTVAWTTHLQAEEKSAKRAQAEIEKAAQRKHMQPSERKLYALADRHAADNGITVQKAVAELLKTDEGRALYAAAHVETLGKRS